MNQSEARQLAARVGGVATTRDAIARRWETSHEWVVSLSTGSVLDLTRDELQQLREHDQRDELQREMNDDASAYVPECPECGAAPGQAHDPVCRTRNPR